MATAYKCDACGKFFEDNKIKIKLDRHRKPVRCNTILFYSRDSLIDDRFDICDECLLKILDIFHVKPVEEQTNGEEENTQIK